jgi:hypothetical protein
MGSAGPSRRQSPRVRQSPGLCWRSIPTRHRAPGRRSTLSTAGQRQALLRYAGNAACGSPQRSRRSQSQTHKPAAFGRLASSTDVCDSREEQTPKRRKTGDLACLRVSGFLTRPPLALWERGHRPPKADGRGEGIREPDQGFVRVRWSTGLSAMRSTMQRSGLPLH